MTPTMNLWISDNLGSQVVVFPYHRIYFLLQVAHIVALCKLPSFFIWFNVATYMYHKYDHGDNFEEWSSVTSCPYTFLEHLFSFIWNSPHSLHGPQWITYCLSLDFPLPWVFSLRNCAAVSLLWLLPFTYHGFKVHHVACQNFFSLQCTYRPCSFIHSSINGYPDWFILCK